MKRPYLRRLNKEELVDKLTEENKQLKAALKENYEFTKYAGANKKLNTDEYMKEFFIKGESAQKIAKKALKGK